MWLVLMCRSFITFYSFLQCFLLLVGCGGGGGNDDYGDGVLYRMHFECDNVTPVYCHCPLCWFRCEEKTFYCQHFTLHCKNMVCSIAARNPITIIFPIGISQPNRQTCRFTQLSTHTHTPLYTVFTMWTVSSHIYVHKTAKSQRNLAKSPAHHQTITIDNCLSFSVSLFRSCSTVCLHECVLCVSFYDKNQYGHLTGHSTHIHISISQRHGNCALVHSNVPFTWQQFTVMISNFIFILFIRSLCLWFNGIVMPN